MAARQHDHILDVARTLVADVGYDATTMEFSFDLTLQNLSTTGTRSNADTRPVHMVMPADGPSFGIAPSGRCTWMAARL